MKTGDRISVHAPDSYTDLAIVAACCHPDELPHTEGAPNIELVRGLLAGGNYVTVALIEYKFLDETLAFIALEDTRGKWTDLRGTPLIIEPRKAENEARTKARPYFADRNRGIDWSKF